MRVVSGKYRGRKIYPPKKFHSRPTTDFAKESLFNILEHQLEWEAFKVLDLFAGSGSISVEFLSRGAASVLSVDKHPKVIQHLHQLKSEFNDENWSISKADVFQFIEKSPQSFDLIFADPPFGMKQMDELVDRVLNSTILSDEGLFILEHGGEHQFENHPQFTKTKNYGGVNFTFFER